MRTPCLLLSTLLAQAALAMPGATDPAAQKKPAPAVNAYAVVQAPSGPMKVSLFSDEHADLAVAKAGEEVVTLRDLAEALASTHAEMAGTVTKKSGGKKDFSQVLDRLIGTRLVLLEAREMGLHELPEVQKAVKAFSEVTLREVLRQRATEHVKADAMVVDRLYREAIAEWKLRSVLFKTEADAKAFHAAVNAGGDFEALGAKAVADKKAEGNAKPDFLPRDQMLPEVIAAAQPLGKGQTGPVVRVEQGFVVLRVEDIRYPKDALLKAQTEERVRAAAQQAEVARFVADLEKRTAKVDRKLLASLDFEAAKPGFEALLKDPRVVATVEGGQPVTVAQIADEIRQIFFHGIENPIKNKQVNKRKDPSFTTLLHRRLLDAEAGRRNIASSREYKRLVADYESSIVFGMFLKKAVVPEVQVMESEGRAHYEKHKADYTFPAFYGLNSVAFWERKEAQAAFDKLKAGSDFKWVKTTATGQVPPEGRAFDFDAKTVSAGMLTPDVAKLLSGSKKGDVRLHAAKDGNFYVLQVWQVTPPRPQPYVEAREEILKKVYDQKMNQAVQDWIAKLRKAQKVQVFITQIVT